MAVTFRTARSLVAAGAFALAGALMADGIFQRDPPLPEETFFFPGEIIVFYAVGGAIAGMICASLFGRAGIGGVLAALAGGVLATLLAGIFGGAMSSIPVAWNAGSVVPELIGIGFGAISYPLAAAGAPLAGVYWIVIVMGTHVLSRIAARTLA